MPSLKNNTLETLLGLVLEHREQKKPFAVFRYPGEAVVKGIFQSDSRLHTAGNFDRSGFLVGPFGKEKPAFMILPHKTVEVSVEETRSTQTSSAESREPELEEKRYKNLVSKAVKAIEDGALNKVVLSRQFEVTTGKSALDIFSALLPAYPSAFCYCWYHPEAGCWVGATPETLLRYAKGVFSTMSLAGTLEKKAGEEPGWGPKEREEQQMVTDYIAQVLSQKGIQARQSAVETAEAGNLWHLRTTLSGEVSADQVPALISALHPTPAVCGIPLQDAREFILENEGYSRGYYTGFLGELHKEQGQETRLFVNLRCLEYLEDRARIFVGGGITADSDPEKEWEETRAKGRTMLRVL